MYLLNRHESDAEKQYTDDAYVQADFTLVAPRVAGQIAKVLVEDNETVRAGQLLAEIDDRDVQVMVAAANAEINSAQASVESINAHLLQQANVIQQADAAVVADDASIALAQANLQRYRNLAKDGSGTLQEAQQADAQLRIQQATRQRDQAAQGAARQQVNVLRADLKKAQAALARANAALSSAQLNLSYTRISAPVAGTVARRSVRVGSYVTVGNPLLALVPLDSLYIEANYRETQLVGVHPGQAVRIKVDALPGVILTGRVTSLGPASDVSFSPIAPHNATGNFTKIVQRLPLRINLSPGQKAIGQLRVGMSVQPTIDKTDGEERQHVALSH
ncbi:HlyD family secretion protein [Collimonas sp. OK307]|uniref:HlyD family secretion protein n=1 Tax=Collimonas sp. OK307 TaxID=1801620 RepID=UPI0020C84CB7|nr:HlyD family secretion protein [Collimonas sp. OK307]